MPRCQAFQRHENNYVNMEMIVSKGRIGTDHDGDGTENSDLKVRGG